MQAGQPCVGTVPEGHQLCEIEGSWEINVRLWKHHEEGPTCVAKDIVDAVGRLIMVPAFLVPLLRDHFTVV